MTAERAVDGFCHWQSCNRHSFEEAYITILVPSSSQNRLLDRKHFSAMV